VTEATGNRRKPARYTLNEKAKPACTFFTAICKILNLNMALLALKLCYVSPSLK